MAISQEFCDVIIERLQGIGNVTGKKMFGGFSIYCDDLIFAVAADDVLYFKVDDTTEKEYTERGMGRFNPMDKSTKSGGMSYCQLPPDVFDDIDELWRWGKKAVEVSRKNPTKKKKKKT